LNDSVSQFLVAVGDWANYQENISELLLVGSHASREATPDSDIDLVLLCKNPTKYLEETGWIDEFGAMKDQKVEDWGKVKSLRVWYQNGLEVEFGFAAQDWIDQPLDEGTLRVLSPGYKILLDKESRLANLNPKI
jgi:predicted nucleotidyltransferase